VARRRTTVVLYYCDRCSPAMLAVLIVRQACVAQVCVRCVAMSRRKTLLEYAMH
jgi:hypothetical protein